MPHKDGNDTREAKHEQSEKKLSIAFFASSNILKIKAIATYLFREARE